MQRLYTLPIVSGVDFSAAADISIDWVLCEKKYGREILPELRNAILVETQKLVRGAKREREAEPLDHANDRVLKIETAARGFLSALCEHLHGPDAAFHAKRLIWSNFHDARVPQGANKQEFMTGLATSVVVACDRAKAELRNDGRGNYAGIWWEEWVRRLTALAQSHGLPTGARKDSDKQNGSCQSSPFVALIWALQECIPAEFRRSHNVEAATMHALAKAIGKARASKERSPPV